MTTVVDYLAMAQRRAYGSGRIFVKHDAWYGSWRMASGTRATRKLGPVRKGRDGLTKTQAEVKLRELMLADASVKIPRGIHAPTVQQIGIALIARLERDNKKRSHIESVESHLRAHINPMIGDQRVCDITDADVDRLVARMLRDGKSPKTIRNNVGTLHSVMERAAKDGFVARNPVSMSDLPRVRKSRGLNFLTLEELDRVIDTPLPASDEELIAAFPASRKKDRTSEFGGPQAVRDWWPVLRLAILIAAMTGLRLGELRGLRWRDLGVKLRVGDNFVRGEFEEAKSEAGHGRGVPIAKRVMDELEAHHKRTPWNQDDDLVLAHPHTGRPLDRVRLGLHYQAALKRAGVKSVRFHDLRHTFATTIAASGQVSLRTLQEWMGHESLRTTQIYSHYMPAEREAALIDDAFTPRTPIRTPLLPHTDQHSAT